MIFSEEDTKAVLAMTGFRHVAPKRLEGIGWQFNDLADRLIAAQWRRREDAKGEARVLMGPELRASFFRELEQIWLDFPKAAKRLAAHTRNPSVTRDPRTGIDDYQGRSMRYMKAYCAHVANYLQENGPRHKAISGMAAQLKRHAASGANIRDALKLSGFRAEALRVTKEVMGAENPR